MKKKLLPVIVAAALSCSLFSAVPMVSQAAEWHTSASEEYLYFVDNGGCTIASYRGADKNVVIPPTIDGYAVLAVGGKSDGDVMPYAPFANHKGIISVTIPDTVQSIGNVAFQNCTGLTRVDLPETLESVGVRVFEGCSSLKDIYAYSKNTKYDYSMLGDSDIPPVTIHGYPGSTTEMFAREHNLTFVSMTGEVVNRVDVYRLYNPLSGEHFYTASKEERDVLKSGIWYYEGIGWTSPEYSNHPVYRLCNPNTGDHHYTIDENEKNICVGYGWIYEGIGWYSDDAQTVPVYRDYNPNAVMGTHNYTTSESEHDNIVSLGWRSEDIGWYVALQGRGDVEADYYPYMRTDDVRWGHLLENWEIDDKRVIRTKGQPVLRGYSYSTIKEGEFQIPFYGIIEGRSQEFLVLQKDGTVFCVSTPGYGTPWTIAYNSYGEYSGYYGKNGTRVYTFGVSEEDIKKALDQGLDPATIYDGILEL